LLWAVPDLARRRRGEDCQAGLLPSEAGEMGKIGLRLRMTWLKSRRCVESHEIVKRFADGKSVGRLIDLLSNVRGDDATHERPCRLWYP